MKRDYDTGVKDNVEFFVGTEVEKTPAYGMKTLFVTGIHSYITIKQHIACLLYTSPSPRDRQKSRMPSSA